MADEEGRWLDGAETAAWRSFLTASSRLLQRLDEELVAASGLSLADYEVLAMLSHSAEGKMRMAALAECALVSPSGLTRRLDRLVRDGLVERTECPTDRRGVLAVLTATGRSRLEAAAPVHVAGVRRYFIEGFSRRQLGVVARAMAEVAERSDRRPVCD